MGLKFLATQNISYSDLFGIVLVIAFFNGFFFYIKIEKKNIFTYFSDKNITLTKPEWSPGW